MQASSNDLVFALPTGYIEQRNGEVIILAPATTNERTSCLYGLAGCQPSTGILEAAVGRAFTAPLKKFFGMSIRRLSVRRVNRGRQGGTDREAKHACNGDCEGKQGV